jgi:hypothetical protein
MTRVKRHNRRIRAGLVLAFLLVALIVPAQAGAQTPTDSQYAPPSQITIGGGGGGEPPAEPFGPLPFTGLDMISLLAIAVALTGAGLALRRLSSTEGS